MPDRYPTGQRAVTDTDDQAWDQCLGDGAAASLLPVRVPDTVPVAPASKPAPSPEMLRRVLDGLRGLPG